MGYNWKIKEAEEYAKVTWVWVGKWAEGIADLMIEWTNPLNCTYKRPVPLTTPSQEKKN